MNRLHEFSPGCLFLVTGGAGFIGSNLCEAILRLGCRVRCLDNLSTGNPSNIEPFMDNPMFAFLKGDILDLGTCMEACQGVDYVLHEAAWGSIPRSLEMPLPYCSNNILGTLNMMEAARTCGVRTFVYASSSSVYGNAQRLPSKEGDEGDAQSPYGVTKLANEMWAKQYSLHYNLRTIGLRYFNVFGRRQNPNGAYAAVIPKFIYQFLHDEHPTIEGDGTQSRDFTFIDNVVQANFKACLAPEEANGEVFNISGGEEKTIMDVFNVLSCVLGKKVDPIFIPNRHREIKHSCADIGKAMKLLGYTPQYGFMHGILDTVNWYKSIYKL